MKKIKQVNDSYLKERVSKYEEFKQNEINKLLVANNSNKVLAIGKDKILGRSENISFCRFHRIFIKMNLQGFFYARNRDCAHCRTVKMLPLS
jgi:hypothetical protein